MLDNFDCFGDKLLDEFIFSVFLLVVSKLRRGVKFEGKVSSRVGVSRFWGLFGRGFIFFSCIVIK